MYKEYREMSRCEAVDALYQDMAARHRARFRSVHVRLTNDSVSTAMLTVFVDPQGCRDREDRRYQTPIPQAAPHQGPVVPSPTSHSKGSHQEDLRSQQAIDFLLSELHIMVLWGGFQSKIGYQWQGFYVAPISQT